MAATYFDTLDWRLQMAALYAPLANAQDLQALWPDFVRAKHRLVHSHRAGIRVQDTRSPMFFDYNPALALASTIEPLDKAEPLVMDGGSDGHIRLLPFARTGELKAHLGSELTLYWFAHYGGGIFLPFKDATSGTQTYGGGRYLLDTPKSAWLGQDAQGRLRLDFNFSYFPSCAHDLRFVCPLSPPENTLPAAITAGERWPEIL